jgi:2-polyprenyl-3-methyl-5-hydroxy-6-metoxy-1,4-benzoquinol methylase
MEYMNIELNLPTDGGVCECCPICGEAFDPVIVNQYFRLIGRCCSCSHHFVVNPWTDEEIAAFYKGFEYFSKNFKHQGIRSISQDAEWESWVASRLGTLERCCLSQLQQDSLVILEQGCLEGRVLNALAEKGHQVTGCDVNARVVHTARSCFGIDIRAGTIETCNFAPGAFDLIYSFHTLEHLRDPVRNLATSKVLLKPGGMLFFEIPLNETDYNNRDHLHFFSTQSVEKVMRALYKEFNYEVASFTTGAGIVRESILVWAFK